MLNLEGILLDVWREACRHIRINEATASIADLLLRQMALSRVLVRRIDMRRSCLETVAIALVAPGHPMEGGRSECSPELLRQLLTWCNAGEVLRLDNQAGALNLRRVIVPEEIQDDVIAAPLCDSEGPAGVVVLVAQPGRKFTDTDRAALHSLVEPFAVALENDRRLREIAALREAAEADRSSLLSKLGRNNLGDTIVGEEQGLRGVMQRVELVARSDVPVLIFGETGTGKEVVGRAIHTRSGRAAGPFLRVNCGAIPPELIDSQLFGHERGSFTGATGTHRGWFERADRGTLFLDEIGELPPAAQVRLLRVLQDGAFERVGAQQPITVDVRIVAATHRDLSGMVRQGRFREDLWYRLAVFSLSIPPLRERTADIPALARHFADRAATRFGLAPRMPTSADLGLLISYGWPGNVRELAAVMDRAAILGDGQALEVAKALGVQTESPPAAAQSLPCEPAALTRVISLDSAMRQHIELALRAANGRIEGRQGAAALLEINPHTLRARMRKLGIAWDAFRA